MLIGTINITFNLEGGSQGRGKGNLLSIWDGKQGRMDDKGINYHVVFSN
jgi:hypothetical protein